MKSKLKEEYKKEGNMDVAEFSGGYTSKEACLKMVEKWEKETGPINEKLKLHILNMLRTNISFVETLKIMGVDDKVMSLILPLTNAKIDATDQKIIDERIKKEVKKTSKEMKKKK